MGKSPYSDISSVIFLTNLLLTVSADWDAETCDGSRNSHVKFVWSGETDGEPATAFECIDGSTIDSPSWPPQVVSVSPSETWVVSAGCSNESYSCSPVDPVTPRCQKWTPVDRTPHIELSDGLLPGGVCGDSMFYSTPLITVAQVAHGTMQAQARFDVSEMAAHWSRLQAAAAGAADADATDGAAMVGFSATHGVGGGVAVLVRLAGGGAAQRTVVFAARPTRGPADAADAAGRVELFAHGTWVGVGACRTIAAAGEAGLPQSYVVTCVGGLPLEVGGRVGRVTLDGAVAALHARAVGSTAAERNAPAALPADAGAFGTVAEFVRARARAAAAAAVGDARAAAGAAEGDLVTVVRVDAFAQAAGAAVVGYMRGVQAGRDGSAAVWTCAADDDTSGHGRGRGVWVAAGGDGGGLTVAHVAVGGGGGGEADEPFEDTVVADAVGGVGRVRGVTCGHGAGLAVAHTARFGGRGDADGGGSGTTVTTRCAVDPLRGLVCGAGLEEAAAATAAGAVGGGRGEDGAGDAWGRDGDDEAWGDGGGADDADGGWEAREEDEWVATAGDVMVRQPAAQARSALVQQVGTPWGEVIRLAPDTNAAGAACVWMAIAGTRVRQLGAAAPYVALGGGTGQLIVAHACPVVTAQTFAGAFELDFNGRPVEHHKDVMPLKVTRAGDVWVSGNAFSSITYRVPSRRYMVSMDDRPCVFMFRLAPVTATVLAHRVICSKRITQNGFRGVNVSAAANHGMNGLVLAVNPSTPSFRLDGRVVHGWGLGLGRTNYSVLVSFDEDAKVIEMRTFVPMIYSATSTVQPAFVISHIAERLVEETGVGRFSGYDYFAAARYSVVSGYSGGLAAPGSRLEPGISPITFAFITFRADLVAEVYRQSASTARFEVADIVPRATGGWSFCANTSNTISISGVTSSFITWRVTNTMREEVYASILHNLQGTAGYRTGGLNHSGVFACSGLGDGGLIAASVVNDTYTVDGVATPLPAGVTQLALFRRLTPTLTTVAHVPLAAPNAGAITTARAVAVLSDGRVLVGGRVTVGGAVKLTGDAGAYAQVAFMDPSPESVGMLTATQYAAAVVRAIHPPRASVLRIARDTLGGYWAAMAGMGVTNELTPVTVTNYARQLIVMRFSSTHVALAGLSLQWPTDPLPNSGADGTLWGLVADGYGGVWVGGTRSGSTAWTCGSTALAALGGATDVFVFRVSLRAVMAFCKAVGTASEDYLYDIAPHQRANAVLLMGTTATTVAYGALGPMGGSVSGLRVGTLLLLRDDGTFVSQQVVSGGARHVRLYGASYVCGMASLSAPQLHVMSALIGSGTLVTGALSVPITAHGGVVQLVFEGDSLTPASWSTLTAGGMSSDDLGSPARVAWGYQRGMMLLCTLTHGQVGSAAAASAGVSDVRNVLVMRVRDGRVMWHVTIESVYEVSAASVNASVDCDEDGAGGVWVVYTYEQAHTVRGAVKTTTYPAPPAVASVLLYIDAKGRIMYHTSYVPVAPATPAPVHGLRMRALRMLPSCTFVIGGWMADTNIVHPEAKRWTAPWVPTAPEHGLLMAMAVRTCVPLNMSMDVCEFARPVMSLSIPSHVICDIQMDVTDLFWVRVIGSYSSLTKGVYVKRFTRDGTEFASASVSYYVDLPSNMTWTVDGIGGVWIVLGSNDNFDPYFEYNCMSNGHTSPYANYICHIDGRGEHVASDTISYDRDYPGNAFLSSIATYLNGGCIFTVLGNDLSNYGLPSTWMTTQFMVAYSTNGTRVAQYRFPTGSTSADQLTNVRIVPQPTPPGSLTPRWLAVGTLGGGPYTHSFTLAGKTATSTPSQVSIYVVVFEADLTPRAMFEVARSTTWVSMWTVGAAVGKALVPIWTHGTVNVVGGQSFTAVSSGRSLTASVDLTSGTVYAAPQYSLSPNYVNITSVGRDSAADGWWVSGTTMTNHFELWGHSFGTVTHTRSDSRVLMYVDASGTPIYRMPFGAEGNSANSWSHLNVSSVAGLGRCRFGVAYNTSYAEGIPTINLTHGAVSPIRISSSFPSGIHVFERQVGCDPEADTYPYDGTMVYASMRTQVSLVGAVGAESVRIHRLVRDGARGVWVVAFASELNKFGQVNVQPYNRQLVVALLDSKNMFVRVALAVERASDGPFMLQPDDVGGVWMVGAFTAAMQFGGGAALAPSGGVDVAIVHYTSLLKVLTSGTIGGPGNEVPTAFVPSVSPTAAVGTSVMIALTTTTTTSVNVAGTAVSMVGVGASGQANSLIVEVHHGKRDDTACLLEHTGTRLVLPSVAAGAVTVAAMTTSCANVNTVKDYRVGMLGNLIMAVVAVRGATTSLSPAIKARGTYLLRIDGRLAVVGTGHLFDSPVDAAQITPDGMSGQWVCTALNFPLRSAFGAVAVPYAGDDYCVRVDIGMRTIAHNRANAPLGGLWLKAIDGDGEGGVWTLSSYHANVAMQRGLTTVPNGRAVNVLTHIGRDGSVSYATAFDTRAMVGLRVDSMAVLPMCDVMVGGHNGGTVGFPFGFAGDVAPGTAMFGVIRNIKCNRHMYTGRSTVACPLWFPTSVMATHTHNFNAYETAVLGVVSISSAGGFFALIRFSTQFAFYGLRLRATQPNGYALVRFDMASEARRARVITARTVMMTTDDMDGIWFAYSTGLGSSDTPPRTVQFGDTPMHITTMAVVAARLTVDLDVVYQGVILNGTASGLVIHSRRDGSGGLVIGFATPDITVQAGSFTSTRLSMISSSRDIIAMAMLGNGFVEWGDRIYQLTSSMSTTSVAPTATRGGILAVCYSSSSVYANYDGSLVTTNYYTYSIYHFRMNVKPVFVARDQSNAVIVPTVSGGVWTFQPGSSWSRLSYFDTGLKQRNSISLHDSRVAGSFATSDGDNGLWVAFEMSPWDLPEYGHSTSGARLITCGVSRLSCSSLYHINMHGVVDFSDDLLPYASIDDGSGISEFSWWNEGYARMPSIVPIGGTCGIAFFFTTTLAYYADFGLPNGPPPPNGTVIRTFIASYHTSANRAECSPGMLHANSRNTHSCSALPLAPVAPVAPLALSPPPEPLSPPPIPFAPVPTAPMHLPKAPVPIAPTPVDAPAPLRPQFTVGGWSHVSTGVAPVPVAPADTPPTLPQWPEVLTQHSGISGMTLQMVIEDVLGGLWCVVGATNVATFLTKSVTSAAQQWIFARVDYGFTVASFARSVTVSATLPVTQVRAMLPDGYGGVWVVAEMVGAGSITTGCAALPFTASGAVLVVRYSYRLDCMGDKMYAVGTTNALVGATSYVGGGVTLATAVAVTAMPFSLLGGDCTVTSGTTGVRWMVAALDVKLVCRRIRLLRGTVYGLVSDTAPAAVGAQDAYVVLVGYPAGVTDDLGTVHGVAGPLTTNMLRLSDAAGFPTESTGVVTRTAGFSGSVRLALDGVGGVWMVYYHTVAAVHLRDRSDELPYVRSIVFQRHDATSFVLQAFLHVGVGTSADLRALQGDGSGGVWLVGEATGGVSIMPSRLSYPNLAARRPVIMHAASFRLFDSSFVAVTSGSGSAWGTTVFPWTPPTFVDVGCKLAYGVQSDAALQVRYPKPVGETTGHAGAVVLEVAADVDACKDSSVPRVAVGSFVPTLLTSVAAPVMLTMRSTNDGGWITAVRVDATTATSYLGAVYPAGGSGSELLVTMYEPGGRPRCTFVLGYGGGTTSTIGAAAVISPRRDGSTWVTIQAAPTAGTARLGPIGALTTLATVAGANYVALCVSATCGAALYVPTAATVSAMVNGPEDQLIVACHSTTATTVVTHAVGANQMALVDIALDGSVTRGLNFAANDARLVSSLMIDCHTMMLFTCGTSATAHATNIPGTVGALSLVASRVYVVRVWLEDFLSKGHWVSGFAAEGPLIAPHAKGVWVSMLVTGTVTASVSHPPVGTKDLLAVALTAQLVMAGSVRVGALDASITAVRAAEEEVSGGVVVSAMLSVTTPLIVRDGGVRAWGFSARGGAMVAVILNPTDPYLDHVVPLSTSGSFVALHAVSSGCALLVGGSIDRAPTAGHPAGALPVVRVGHQVRREMVATDSTFVATIRTRDQRCLNPQYRAAFCALRPPPVPNSCPKSIAMSVDAGVLVESPVIPPVVGWSHGDNIRPGAKFDSHNCQGIPQFSGPPSIELPADGKSLYVKSRTPTGGAEWCTGVSGDGNYLVVGERGLVDVYTIDPFTRAVALEVRLRSSSDVIASVGTHFGAAVMLRGGVLVVGAPADSAGVTNDQSGAAATMAGVGSGWVYERTQTRGPNVFSEMATIRHPLHAHAGLGFGTAVAVSVDGRVIAVGAPGDVYGHTTASGVVVAPYSGAPAAAGSGSVAVFARAFAATPLGGGVWYSTGLVREVSGSAAAGRGFGSAVGVDGTWPTYVLVGSGAAVGYVQVNLVTMGGFMQPMAAAGGTSVWAFTPPAPHSGTATPSFGASVAVACTSATVCVVAVGAPEDDHCEVGVVAVGAAYSGGCGSRGGVWVATVDTASRMVAYEVMVKPPAAVPSEFGAAVRLRCVGGVCHFAVGGPIDSMAGTGRISAYGSGGAASGTGFAFRRTTGPLAYTWQRVARPIHEGDVVGYIRLGAAVDAIHVAGTTYRAALCAPRAGNALSGVNVLTYQGGAENSGALYLEEYP